MYGRFSRTKFGAIEFTKCEKRKFMRKFDCFRAVTLVGALSLSLVAQAGTSAPSGCPQELSLHLGQIQAAPLDDVISHDDHLIRVWAALQNASDLNLKFKLYWKSDVEFAPGAPQNWRVVTCFYEEGHCQNQGQSCRNSNHQLSYYPDPMGVNDQYRFNTQIKIKDRQFDLKIPLKTFSETSVELSTPSITYPLMDWGTNGNCSDPFMDCSGFQYRVGEIADLTLISK
jgi:hypothetical protein